MQTQSQTVVHSDPDILAGTPVFRGTRVPVQSLFDYLEGGETLDEFLDQFPSVSKKQALAALDLARINPAVKEEAATVLAAMGLTVSDALRLLLTKDEKAMPFAPLVPNAVTIEAMEEARRGGLPRFTKVEVLLGDLRAQD